MDVLQKAEKVIKKAKHAFVTYCDEEGFPIVKAVFIAERHGLTEFWFSTNTSSDKVRCYLQNNKASVYFYDRIFYRGVCLTGAMEVLQSPEAKQRLWHRGDTRYYPQGVTDPDYIVLRFTPTRGRYYASYHNENFSL